MICFMLSLLLGTLVMATELKNYSINKHFPKINESLDTGIYDIFETSEVVETDAVQDRKTPKGSKSKKEKKD